MIIFADVDTNVPNEAGSSMVSNLTRMFNKKSTNLFKVFAVRILTILLGLGLFTNLSFGQTTNGSGNWSSVVVNAPWPGGTVPAATGLVTIANTHIVTLTGVITQTSGTLTLGGNGTLRLAGNNFTAGTLTAVGAGVIDNNSAAAATFTVGGNGTLNSYTGVITQTGGGAVSLIKNGAGVLLLSGANLYTGLTTISAGTIRVGSITALGTNAAGTSVTSGAALDLNGINYSTTEALTLNGTGTGATTGALLNSNAAAATFAGTVALGSSSTINTTNQITLSGIVSGVNTNDFTKEGAGLLILSGTNTYSGDTRINAGTLRAGSTQAFGVGSAVIMANTAGAILDITGFNNTIGSLTGGGGTGGNITLGAATLSIGSDNTSPAAYAGVISGTGGVTKTGTGTLSLSGNNSYSGVNNVNAGTLSITSNANALGTTASNTFVAAGATLDLNNITAVAEPLNIQGTGNAGVGALTVSAGTSSLSGAVTLAAASSIGGNGTQLTLNGVIGGAFSLTKEGSSNLVLSNVGNNYGGATVINNGTLTLGAAGVIPNGSAVSVASGKTFDMVNFAETVGSIAGAGNITSSGATLTTGADNTNTTFSGIIQNAVALTKTGTGTLTLTGANTYTGATNVSGGGVLNIQNNSGLGTTGSGTTVASGSALELQGNVAVGEEELTLTGTGIASNGALRHISGANTYGGKITLAGATTIQSDDGTLIINADSTTTNAITGTNQNLFLEGAGNGIVSGTITTGTGTLTKNDAGTWSLSGASTYSGAVTINNGTLSVSSIANSGTNSALGTGNTTPTIAIAATGTLKYTGSGHSSSRVVNLTGSGASLDASGSGSMTLTGGVTGSARNLILTGSGVGVESGVIATTTGSVTKTGTGSWSLTGANTYTGGTVISAGTLSLGAAGVLLDAGKVTLNGGTLSTLTFAESMGILALTDNSTIELGPSSTLNFLASSSEPWTSGKKLTINGWRGSYTGTTGTTGTGSKIFVGSGSGALTATQLSQIQFFNAGNYYPATIIAATGEIVPLCVGAAVTSASSGSVTSGVANNVNYDITGGTTYTWSRAAVTGISNTARTGQTSDPIVETLTNTTTSSINVTYVINTAASGGCASGTFNYVVSVNPVNTATCPSVPAAPSQPACGSLTNLAVSPTATSIITPNQRYGFCGTSFTSGNIDGASSGSSIIYVLSGQTLTVSGNLNSAGLIYVFAGGTLNLTGDYNTAGGQIFLYGTMNNTSATAVLQGTPSTIWIAPGAVYNANNLQMSSTGVIVNEGTMKINTLSSFSGAAKLCLHNSGCLQSGAFGVIDATNIITFGGSLGYIYYSGTTCPTGGNNDFTASTDLRICTSISTATASASPGGNCDGKFGSAQVTYGCTPSYINCPGAIALPITLTFFKPTLTNEGVIIKWGTNSQWDSDYFIIEKSKNGIDWEYVSQVSSENGKYRYKEYSVTDPNPYQGDSYYRLVEVDNNGKRTVYATDFIHNDQIFAGFSIYPNPSNGSFIVSISGDSPQYQLNLFDVLGKNIGVYTLLAGKNEISTDLASGVYLAKLKVGRDYFTQKIVVK